MYKLLKFCGIQQILFVVFMIIYNTPQFTLIIICYNCITFLLLCFVMILLHILVNIDKD